MPFHCLLEMLSVALILHDHMMFYVCCKLFIDAKSHECSLCGEGCLFLVIMSSMMITKRK
jgi:hypothetical protein